MSHGTTTQNMQQRGTTTSTPNVPGWLASPYQNFAGQIGGLMGNDPSNYTTPASQLQTQAFSGIGAQQPNAATGQGIQATQGLLGFNPQQVNAPGAYSPDTVQAGLLRDTDLQPYMNPYTGEVIDRSLADLDRQRQIAISGGQGAATAAGAYGGSRHGVADSLTNEAALREAGLLSSGLRAQNFSQAQQAATGDIGRTLSADLANQAARQQAGLAGNEDQMRAQMANQQAGLQGQQLNLGAAQQLSNMGLMSDENTRAMLNQQLDAGGTQRQIAAANNPWLAQLELLNQQGGLLGQIPGQLFTPITEQQNQTGTGRSNNSPIWSLFG